MNYEDKNSEYFTYVRKDLVSLIELEKNLKILEVGAGFGHTLNYLKQTGVASEGVGLDIFEDISRIAEYQRIDRFIFGNIEDIELSEYKNYFDLILLGDVLEHLIEPATVLDKLKTYLNQDGEILVSMPNIRHYSTFIKIFIKGNFDYEESGIFDYTHRRFFCKKNIKSLLETNFRIINEISSIHFYKNRSGAKILNKFTFGLFEQFLTVQYFYKAVKKT